MGSDKPPRDVAVAIICDSTTSKVLMITSRKHPHLWILPKGGVEKGETSGQAAVRESWEEGKSVTSEIADLHLLTHLAGSPKDLQAPTDDERLMMLALNDGASKRPSVWHIHVIRTSEAAVEAVTDWPEIDERKRGWFSTFDALEKIHQWYGDPKASNEASGESEELSDKKSKHTKKKGLKGGAMETAFRAFMDSEGITKAE